MSGFMPEESSEVGRRCGVVLAVTMTACLVVLMLTMTAAGVWLFWRAVTG